MSIPKEIIVPTPLPDAKALAELLSERRETKVQVIFPKRGPRADQIAMANMNAKQLLEEHLKDDTELKQRLTRIQRRLRLPNLPHHIECVDISHLAGGNTVGAISVVIDGQINRARGRTYHVRTASGGDDFTAIKEVLSRRFTRAKSGDESWRPPDLLVVDGGRSHLASARAVLSELEFESQPVVALAKERSNREKAESDRVYLPGRVNPIPLKTGRSSLQLLAMARDEAHRLAVVFQRKTRRKRTLASELDAIDGVGPKLKKELLKQLGSVKRIKRASIDELTAIPGVGAVLAAKIKESLGSAG
jgi:excinuclease ABC subunit C